MNSTVEHLDSSFLMRVLGDENTTSDLLAALIMAAPEPLASELDIEPHSLTVRREAVLADRSRIDLQILSDKKPVALLELKVGASSHGDQFDKYSMSATDLEIPAGNLWCIAPMQNRPAFLKDHPNWHYKSLNDFLSLWEKDSVATEQRWFATSLSKSFSKWQELGDKRFTVGDPFHVLQIQMQTARAHIQELMEQRVPNNSDEKSPYFLSRATTINGPNPAVYLGRSLGDPQDTWAWVDARANGTREDSHAQTTTNGNWQIRVGIDCTDSQMITGSSDPETVDTAVLAFQREFALGKFTKLAPEIEFSKLKTEFPFPESLVVTAKHDGYKNKKKDTYLDAGGRQRFLKFDMQVGTITPIEFAELLVDLVDYLNHKLRSAVVEDLVLPS